MVNPKTHSSWAFPITRPRTPLTMVKRLQVLPRLRVTRKQKHEALETERKAHLGEQKPSTLRSEAVKLPSTARPSDHHHHHHHHYKASAPAPPPIVISSKRPAHRAAQQRAAATILTKTEPMTVAAAMKHHQAELSAYEQSEILGYDEIYFVGRTSKKIRGLPQTSRNGGYDDERGDYRIVLYDHIAYRYEVLEVLGKGSFGQVVKVFDHKTGTLKALKIIRNKKRFHHQALIEVRILDFCTKNAQAHDSTIVHMFESMTFRNHLCITFELLSMNLYELIKSSNFRGLTLSLIRRFAVQLLGSLRFLKQNAIIHSDLKPENILLRSTDKSTISLIDFGSSCFETERIYTYIQSRFYRSPEVILGNPYSTEIDIWSFGCILAELYTGYPLFQGENENEQLACIMEIMGIPPLSIYESSPRRKVFFDSNMRPRPTKNGQGRMLQPGSKDLATVLRCSDRKFVDFVARCLEWEPRMRITPDEAMRHPFVTQSGRRRVPTGASRKSGDYFPVIVGPGVQQ